MNRIETFSKWCLVVIALAFIAIYAVQSNISIRMVHHHSCNDAGHSHHDHHHHDHYDCEHSPQTPGHNENGEPDEDEEEDPLTHTHLVLFELSQATLPTHFPKPKSPSSQLGGYESFDLSGGEGPYLGILKPPQLGLL